MRKLIASAALLTMTACAQIPKEEISVKAVSHGTASFYVEGSMTASGERYNKHGLTAAHRTFAFNSKVRVTNLRNNRQTVVRINDYGPASWTGRAIDLSLGAAKEIDMVNAGVVPVKMELLSGGYMTHVKAKRKRSRRR